MEIRLSCGDSVREVVGRDGQDHVVVTDVGDWQDQDVAWGMLRPTEQVRSDTEGTQRDFILKRAYFDQDAKNNGEGVV